MSEINKPFFKKYVKGRHLLILNNFFIDNRQPPNFQSERITADAAAFNLESSLV